MKNLILSIFAFLIVSSTSQVVLACGSMSDGTNTCPPPPPTGISCYADATFKLYDLKLKQYSIINEDQCLYIGLKTSAEIDQCLHDYRVANSNSPKEIHFGSGGYVATRFEALAGKSIFIPNFNTLNVAQEIIAVDNALSAQLSLVERDLSVTVLNKLTGEIKRSNSGRDAKHLTAAVEFEMDPRAASSNLGTDKTGRYQRQAVTLRVTCL